MREMLIAMACSARIWQSVLLGLKCLQSYISPTTDITNLSYARAC